MSFLTEHQISLIEDLIIEVSFLPYYYVLHPKSVWNRYHFIKLSKKLRFHENTLEFWIYSNVLFSQLTIKPPIFGENFCQFSQLLLIWLSAPLPSTLSWPELPTSIICRRWLHYTVFLAVSWPQIWGPGAKLIATYAWDFQLVAKQTHILVQENLLTF